jgi:hypothetical protein
MIHPQSPTAVAKPTGCNPRVSGHSASRWRVLTIGAALFHCAVAIAEGPPAKDTATAKALQKVYLADAEALEFFADAERKQPLHFVRTPVMRWAQPNDWSGDVFLWTRHGRPEIIGCIIAGPDNGAGDRHLYHEFHALTLGTLPTQKLSGGRTWSLSEPAIELKLLRDAPPPADSAPARLTQMRALSREFSVTMLYEGEPWELRLLPQPIFRYETSKDEAAPRDWLDGALFTFVWTTGTDAELVLVFEARKYEDTYRWHYSPVRLTTREVVLKHHDRQVWQVPPHAEPGKDITQPYTTTYVRTTAVKTTE